LLESVLKYTNNNLTGKSSSAQPHNPTGKSSSAQPRLRSRSRLPAGVNDPPTVPTTTARREILRARCSLRPVIPSALLTGEVRAAKLSTRPHPHHTMYECDDHMWCGAQVRSPSPPVPARAFSRSRKMWCWDPMLPGDRE
jgi:hypothetical protein